MNKGFICLLFIGLFSFGLQANECPTLLRKPEEEKALGEVRVRALRAWDTLLTWALAPKNITYQLKSPLEQKKFEVTSEDLFAFAKNYGYFSIFHPIVGIVTDSKRDIEVTKCLLASLHQEKKEQHQFSSDEILAKVMAYRSLKKGMKISLSDSSETYIVDQVIDLWRGMPAFGLLPEGSGPPILLFRGTDLSITSERSWASILSDMDIDGPGYTAFLRGRLAIRSWLEKARRDYAPARLVGFSLGGVFVLYTMIYEYALINQEFPSVAFNSPGISKEILEKWEAIPDAMRTPHIIYVNQGDFVSQIGYFPPNIWEIHLQEPMKVIEAHVSLISTKPQFEMVAVDAKAENASRE